MALIISKDDLFNKKELENRDFGISRVLFLGTISYEKNFLPNIDIYRDKIIYIDYCINKLLQVVLNRQPPDDRDSFTNKRVDLAGDLLHTLFKQSFKQLLKQCKTTFANMNQSNKTGVAYENS